MPRLGRGMQPRPCLEHPTPELRTATKCLARWPGLHALAHRTFCAPHNRAHAYPSHICAQTRACTLTHTPSSTQAQACTHMHTHMHTRTHAHTHACAHAHTLAQTHTHTHARLHTHPCCASAAGAARGRVVPALLQHQADQLPHNGAPHGVHGGWGVRMGRAGGGRGVGEGVPVPSLYVESTLGPGLHCDSQCGPRCCSTYSPWRLTTTTCHHLTSPDSVVAPGAVTRATPCLNASFDRSSTEHREHPNCII